MVEGEMDEVAVVAALVLAMAAVVSIEYFQAQQQIHLKALERITPVPRSTKYKEAKSRKLLKMHSQTILLNYTILQNSHNMNTDRYRPMMTS